MDVESKRQSDLLIGELIGRFEAFQQQQADREKKQDVRDKDAQDFREKFDKRLQSLELLAERINTPVKATLWAVGMVLIAILTKLAFAVISWIQRHWQ